MWMFYGTQRMICPYLQATSERAVPVNMVARRDFTQYWRTLALISPVQLQAVPPNWEKPFSGEKSFTIENNPHLKEESYQLWGLCGQWDRAKPTDVFHQLRHSVQNSQHRRQSTLLPEAQQGTPLWYLSATGNLHFFWVCLPGKIAQRTICSVAAISLNLD